MCHAFNIEVVCVYVCVYVCVCVYGCMCVCVCVCELGLLIQQRGWQSMTWIF